MTHNHEIRIALITDSHAWPGCTRSFGVDEEQLQPWFETIHSSLLAEIRAAQPDLLIHLGDFSCGGGVFQMPDALFYGTMEQLDRDYRAAASAFYGVPGNHDCPYATNDYTFCEQLLGLAPRQGRTVDTDLARLVLLNAQGHSDGQRAEVLPKDPTYGWLAEEELARLEEALASAGDRPVLLFSHQLLHEWANPQPWRSLYGIANSGAVLALFARYGNVRAVFQGHAHLLDVREVQVGAHPVHFVVTPSLIQFPLGWLELTLTSAALRVRYRPLPLPDLAERSRNAGAGSGWRAGEKAWQDFTVGL